MVKPWVKIFGITVIVAVVAFVLVQLGGGSSSSKSEDSKPTKEKLGDLFGKKSKDYITVGLDTYGGHAPIVHLNGGMNPNEDSELYKKYGIKVKFIVVENDRSGFKSGDIDIIFGTVDVRPIEMGSESAMLDSRAFVDANRSRGADALVVDNTINTVADLKNKRVAFPLGQAGHTLLLEVLSTSGLNPTDVLANLDENRNLIKVDNGMDAAEVMKSRQANAALVYSPDDQDLVKNIPGAKVLFSTKQTPNIIIDAFIAKEAFIENNRDVVTKFAEAVLYANVELATNDSYLKAAAKTFAKGFGVDEDFICETDANGNIVSSIRDVLHFSTLGDNINFFGLNPDYTGVTYESLYSRMARIYSSSDVALVRQPVKWVRTVDSSIIESLSNKDLGNIQLAEVTKEYKAPTAQVINNQAVSDKQVVINFATNSAVLDANAQFIIESEFLPIAQNFTNYIRVEGNTDNTGSIEVNKNLSRQRAQAVIDYLVNVHNFDRNRFLPAIGNGSKHAIAAGSSGPDEKFRNTSFQLIAE